ncbi:hypothetical protein GCM10027174_07680 [Salinifilum aidingensis]
MVALTTPQPLPPQAGTCAARPAVRTFTAGRDVPGGAVVDLRTAADEACALLPPSHPRP